MDDREWATRNALNAYLEGRAPNAFRDCAKEFVKRYGWRPWSIDDHQRQTCKTNSTVYMVASRKILPPSCNNLAYVMWCFPPIAIRRLTSRKDSFE